MTCDEFSIVPPSSSPDPCPAILRRNSTSCPVSRRRFEVCSRCHDTNQDHKQQEPCHKNTTSRVTKASYHFSTTSSWIGRICPRPLVASHLITVILLLFTSTLNLASGQLFTNDVINVEMFPRENAKAHRTSAYEITERPGNPSLVIRRGDPFYLAISLRQPYDPQRDKIRLEFMFGTILIILILNSSQFQFNHNHFPLTPT